LRAIANAQGDNRHPRFGHQTKASFSAIYPRSKNWRLCRKVAKNSPARGNFASIRTAPAMNLNYVDMA
jgi:hypothetical protein